MNKEIINTRCKRCETYTNHKILEKTNEIEMESSNDTTEYECFNIIRCLGCDEISFLKLAWDSDIQNDDDILHYNYPEDRFYLYEDEFLSEDDFSYVPNFVSQIYFEVIEAYISDSMILSGIGLRMIVEAVCLNKKIIGKNLKEKISNLFEDGYISKNDLEIIDKLREIGNISAHQIKSHSITVIGSALEAVNHLIRSIYITSRKTKHLRKSNKK